MPVGEEERARAFYVGVLGMAEMPKPPALVLRGGCWFQSGSVQIHLGGEPDFRAARKAHPALRCVDYDQLISRLRSAAIAVDEADDIPGVRRCHIHDPFANRIELVAD
jgi:catechol 2,3-dioxygenase-like lactoylglutathione lyase family enzyme